MKAYSNSAAGGRRGLPRGLLQSDLYLRLYCETCVRLPFSRLPKSQKIMSILPFSFSLRPTRSVTNSATILLFQGRLHAESAKLARVIAEMLSMNAYNDEVRESYAEPIGASFVRAVLPCSCLSRGHGSKLSHAAGKIRTGPCQYHGYGFLVPVWWL